MGKINRPPIGLQSLLGSINFGVNPSELFETVRPTVDLFPFWAQQTWRIDQQTVNTAGFGTVITVTVPEGELWGIKTVALRSEVLSASNDDFYQQIVLRQNLAGTTDHLVHTSQLPPQNIPYQNGTFFGSVWEPPQTYWLEQGTIIAGVYLGSNLAAKDFILDTTYYKLSV
jgi:hypothetical protein